MDVKAYHMEWSKVVDYFQTIPLL